MSEINLSKYLDKIQETKTTKIFGKIDKVVGIIMEGYGAGNSVGGMCEIYPTRDDKNPIFAEVVGFRDEKALIMALSDVKGIGPGSRITASRSQAVQKVGEGLLGRIIDGLGNPIDGKGPLECTEERSIYADPVNPFERNRIKDPLDVGIRAINGVLTVGKGQRIGIFSGSGVGKTTLLGMMARNTLADVNVLALVGERGRELKDFIEKDLGEEGLKRSIVVAATSDHAPLVRMRAAYIATTISEYFRDKGKDVLLMMDSLTRFAMAQREIGLAVGEPPTTKGYTPSVFGLLPKLLERAGSYGKGSITGFYTVLVEGDDVTEPIADATRAILDGHIVLSRDLAEQNHYPSIDILASKSRLMMDVTTEEHQNFAGKVISTYATFKKAEDLINIGAYAPGSNKDIDYSIKIIPRIKEFLNQKVNESSNIPQTVSVMKKIFE